LCILIFTFLDSRREAKSSLSTSILF
jgi:hypothetical protein